MPSDGLCYLNCIFYVFHDSIAINSLFSGGNVGKKNGKFCQKMAYFDIFLAIFPKTTHQIVIIFCNKLTNVIRNLKQLVVTVGKFLFLKFWPFWAISGGNVF